MQPATDGSKITAEVSSMAGRWPCPPNAVEILPAGAARTNYAAWQAARLAGMGGSDIAAALGVGFEKRYGLWLTKTGRRPPIDDTGIMERGRYLESAIAQYLADKAGLSLRVTGTWARLEYDEATGQLVPGWMRCNPDRFTSDGGIVEIKCPNHADWSDLWRHGPALHAVVQLMWCFAVCDVDHGYVAADGPDGLRWWRVERDLDVEAWLIDHAGAFFFDHVVEDFPPDVDGSEQTTLAIKSASLPPEKLALSVQMPGAIALARRRGEIKAALAALTKELAVIENRFKAALTGAVTACEGPTKVLSWRYVALDTPKPYRKLEEPK